MDVTNSIVKICRRITEIEHAIACDDSGRYGVEDLSNELYELEQALEKLQPAT